MKRRPPRETGPAVRLRLGVPGEMNLHALRQQPLAATLAAAGKDGAAVLGLHACAEAELLLARPLGRLVSAFHKTLLLRKDTFWKKSRNSTGSRGDVNRFVRVCLKPGRGRDG